ncbi:MAG: AI-2E family transporter [Syntrophobacteraceae bacterium]
MAEGMDESTETRDRSRATWGTRLNRKSYRPFLLLVLFFSIYLSYLILQPFLDILIIAIVLASLFYPFQMYLNRKLGGRPSIAALVIVFIITFVIAIPVFLFTTSLVKQGVESVNQITVWVNAGNIQKIMQHPSVDAFMDWLHEKLPFLDIGKLDFPGTVLQISKDMGQLVLSKGAVLLGNLAVIVSRFFIMVFIVFFLVRDGETMVSRARYFSPLRKAQEDKILDGVRAVARSVLLGTGLTAICQGLVGGIGLSLVGIPGLFWGTVMGFSSLIPIVGTALVWIPAAGYLALLGKTTSAIFLAGWCIVLVGSIDNFLRPFLMRGEGGLSPFYIFLAIVGGVQYFGLLGILYGPLILSFATIMLYIYGVEYQDDLLLGKGGDEAGASPGECPSCPGEEETVKRSINGAQ